MEVENCLFSNSKLQLNVKFYSVAIETFAPSNGFLWRKCKYLKTKNTQLVKCWKCKTNACCSLWFILSLVLCLHLEPLQGWLHLVTRTCFQKIEWEHWICIKQWPTNFYCKKVKWLIIYRLQISDDVVVHPWDQIAKLLTI